MPTNANARRSGPVRLAIARDGADAVDAAPAWTPADLVADWPGTALTSLVAIVPAFLGAHLPLVAGLAIATAVAIALAIWIGRGSAVPIVLSFIPATVLASSGLLPASTYFLPTATLGLCLVLVEGLRLIRSGIIYGLPARPLVASALAYLLAAVVSSVFSIRPSISLPYLVGIGIVLIASLWLGPWILSSAARAASLFALIGAAGVTVSLVSLWFSLMGPVLWFDRWLGVYLVDELTIAGTPTHVFLLRTTGPFLAPGSQALVLAPAALALLALRPGVGTGARRVIDLALVVTIVGLLSTFARAGWLAVIVGSAIVAFRDVRSRRIDFAAASVCAVMVVAFGALLVNVIGADYRPDLTEARNPAVVNATQPSGDETVPLIPDPGATGDGSTTGGTEPRFQTRGGSELSGRLEIWTASVKAIRDSPWTGYGPGTDAIVIDPYLTGDSRRFAGLTSHNTLLRTWIELGILGIASFIGLVLATFVAARRSRPVDPGRRLIGVGALAIFVGLLTAQGFETFLLGGVSLPSFAWSLAAGLLAVGPLAGLDVSRDATG